MWTIKWMAEKYISGDNLYLSVDSTTKRVDRSSSIVQLLYRYTGKKTVFEQAFLWACESVYFSLLYCYVDWYSGLQGMIICHGFAFRNHHNTEMWYHETAMLSCQNLSQMFCSGSKPILNVMHGV